MKLRVTVNAEGMHFAGGAALIVREPLIEAFSPMRTTDDGFFGGHIKGSPQERRVIRLRTEAAKEIANALTDLLMREMAKNDTHNGYQAAQAQKKEV